MELDDLRIYNGQPCPLPLTSSFTVNSPVCDRSPVICNGTGSSSGSTIPIQYHVWTIGECDAQGTDIPGTPVWWSPFFTGNPGLYTIPSTNGPNFQCGKYYKISLALQNCGNVWATSTKVVYIECWPQVSLSASSTNVCQQDQVTLTANTTFCGSLPCTYAWYRTLPSLQVIPGSSNTVNVIPTGSSAYQVVVTSQSGCSNSAQITVNTHPNTYAQNISTGYDNRPDDLTNPQYPFINFAYPDDEWLCMNNPAGILPPNQHPIIVNTSQNASFPPTANAGWVTGACTGSIYPDNQHVPGIRGPYIYEYHFTIPAYYINNSITFNKFGVDNTAEVYLDNVLIPNLSLMTSTSTNYTVGITGPITVPVNGTGSHVLKVVVYQEDRWTAFLLDAILNESCH